MQALADIRELEALGRDALERAVEASDVRLQQLSFNRRASMFPTTGPLRRELYPKHLEFFRLGGQNRERLAMCANRVGKTEGMGGYEVACHLTGVYPDWWEGRRFERPTRWWVSGDTAETTRDIIQSKLLGPPENQGTGLIEKDRILRTRARSGVPDAIQVAWVRWRDNGLSRLGFKSYDQGRKSFQGTEQDGVWLDEEPPMEVYEECLTRTMTTSGLVIVTATPLKGVTPFILSFLPEGKLPT